MTLQIPHNVQDIKQMSYLPNFCYSYFITVSQYQYHNAEFISFLNWHELNCVPTVNTSHIFHVKLKRNGYKEKALLQSK